MAARTRTGRERSGRAGGERRRDAGTDLWFVISILSLCLVLSLEMSSGCGVDGTWLDMVGTEHLIGFTGVGKTEHNTCSGQIGQLSWQ